MKNVKTIREFKWKNIKASGKKEKLIYEFAKNTIYKKYNCYYKEEIDNLYDEIKICLILGHIKNNIDIKFNNGKITEIKGLYFDGTKFKLPRKNINFEKKLSKSSRKSTKRSADKTIKKIIFVKKIV